MSSPRFESAPAVALHAAPPAMSMEGDHMLQQLFEIIEHRRLTALFQPIVQMQDGAILGYEGLIRGPSDSPLHSPIKLFQTANANGLGVKVEHLCRRVVIEEFVRLQLDGKLFLNVSAESLVQRDSRHGETLHYLREMGLDTERVVIELTESQPNFDYDIMRQAIDHYRAMGFCIAIDDLGEGFSSLRRWSELRPEFVKIDMHFIQGIDRDPVKHQFVNSINEIAKSAGTRVIAEGIETEGELRALGKLGIALGQGYLFARPSRTPAAALLPEVTGLLGARPAPFGKGVPTAEKLARPTPFVDPATPFETVYALFMERADLAAVPMVENGVPVGLLHRNDALMRMAAHFGRELYGKKPCRQFMDADPLIVESSTSLRALGQRIAQSDPRHLSNGFMVVRNGNYLGYGLGHDLMRAMAELQIESARMANPLSGLPGNMRINERIDELLASKRPFVICHCDLDHFKPFNDLYGYAKGDEAIVALAQILLRECDGELDFVGHVGGDDFIVLFGSDDWERRCRAILDSFAVAAKGLFDAAAQRRSSCFAQMEQQVSLPHLTLSLGCAPIAPARITSRDQVAALAVAAKSRAKRCAGNSLFVARDTPACGALFDALGSETPVLERGEQWGISH